MKKFLQQRSTVTLLIAVAVLLVAVVYTGIVSGNGTSSATSSLVGMITTPMQWLANEANDWLDGVFHDKSEEIAALEQQITELQDQISEQNKQLVDYEELKAENERMENALGIKEQHPDWTVVGATVVAREMNELFHGFTVNKGSYAGIKVGDAVLTADGLVGVVTRVSTVYARVDTIFHPDVRVSCFGLQSGDRGILQGDKEACDRNMVCLNDLVPNATIQSGDLVTTSGLGGVYPKGLIVGHVIDVEDNNVDISLTAMVRPAVNIRAVQEVVVLTDFPGRGEYAEALGEETTSAAR